MSRSSRKRTFSNHEDPKPTTSKDQLKTSNIDEYLRLQTDWTLNMFNNDSFFFV